MGDWVLLIPPSESKATAPGNGMLFENAWKSKRTNSLKELNPHREQLIEAVDTILKRRHRLEDIFEARGEALDECIRLNHALRESTTLPARDLYSGVMYEAIRYKTLSKDQKARYNKQTLIFSGLFGLVRPSDRIPPYKLKMSANLGGYIGKVANYWRTPVSEVLRQELKGKVVWNFLPDQHRRVWDGTGEIKANHTVKFVKRVVRSGVAEWKTISHHSKSLKGALIRHLLDKDASTPKALMDFEHPDGYKYSPSLSVRSRSQATLVFAAE